MRSLTISVRGYRALCQHVAGHTRVMLKKMQGSSRFYERRKEIGKTSLFRRI